MTHKNGITILFITFSLMLFGQNRQEGNLVISGGGLENNNSSVFTQLIDLAGGPDKASFAVIPSASGVSVQSFEYFKKTLVSYGVKPDKINLIPVAMVDDDSTEEVDETTWINNGNDVQLAGIVRNCSAVWFTGGDQMRTIKCLVKNDGSKTPVLEAVWEVFHNGGVVGGTSAGAAIMSKAMIGGGNSIGALTHGVLTNFEGDDFPESDGVLLSKGLGFFAHGIVDQHFDARARIGRLIIALFHDRENFTYGFGIDENTALIYLGKDKKLKVAGAGGVTIINTAKAEITYHNHLPEIKNLVVSYLEDGDMLDIQSEKVQPSEIKKPTLGYEYYNITNPGKTGIFTGYANSFRDLITKNLIDNKGANEIQNLNFYNDDDAFLVTMKKNIQSAGFYTDKPDGKDHYTVVDIIMNIEPVTIEIKPLKN
ncbi:MAG: cyanophycinase [Sphingobacteriia bacterium]|nr:cyanophycinase [Sphingobacteriia bacterium]